MMRWWWKWVDEMGFCCLNKSLLCVPLVHHPSEHPLSVSVTLLMLWWKNTFLDIHFRYIQLHFTIWIDTCTFCSFCRPPSIRTSIVSQWNSADVAMRTELPFGQINIFIWTNIFFCYLKKNFFFYLDNFIL